MRGGAWLRRRDLGRGWNRAIVVGGVGDYLLLQLPGAGDFAIGNSIWRKGYSIIEAGKVAFVRIGRENGLEGCVLISK